MSQEPTTGPKAAIRVRKITTTSIAHDLRHYISAMYANAEVLSRESAPQAEREELIFEVQTAVHGMTDLRDSLLVFSRTGNTLAPSYESFHT